MSDSLLATGFPLDSKVNLPLNMAELQALLPMVRNVGRAVPPRFILLMWRQAG